MLPSECRMNIATLPGKFHELDKQRQAELDEARLIQSSMLPEKSLRAGEVTVSHEFHPVDEVGGDFLDYFELSDGTVGLYLGDVSGKGLAAAMYAALAVGTLRGVHKTGQSPSAVLGLLNKRLLLRSLPRRHTAMQYAVFDPRSRRCRSPARECRVLCTSPGKVAKRSSFREFRRDSCRRRPMTLPRCGFNLVNRCFSARMVLRKRLIPLERALESSGWWRCAGNMAVPLRRSFSQKSRARSGASVAKQNSMTTEPQHSFIRPASDKLSGAAAPRGKDCASQPGFAVDTGNALQ